MGNGHLFRNVVGGIVVGSFVGALIALFILPIPKDNEQLITYMLGQLSGFVGGVIAYHYASTATSEQKNKLLARTNEPLPTVVVNPPEAPVQVEQTHD